MEKPAAWRTDRIRFTVSGQGAQRFLSRASAENLRLWSIRCCGDGFSAAACGCDKRRLEQLAGKGGWTMKIEERRGPGRLVERLLQRPGLPLGAVLFLALVRLLSCFVWNIEFGAMEQEQAESVRRLLAENQIAEGTFLTGEGLAVAQQQASARSEEFGWVSLNFTDGCLTVESEPAEFRAVQPPAGAAQLTAKSGGCVVAVEVESGFSAVQVGQYVAQGQTLAVSSRLDRSGAPVLQAVRGRILARVEKEYASEVPLRTEALCLTGKRLTAQQVRFLGREWTVDTKEECDGWKALRETPKAHSFKNAEVRDAWIPLRLGRVSLPGCLYRVTSWERTMQPVVHTEEAAGALARRACRLQLREEFPDAVLDTAQFAITKTEEAVFCRAVFVFVADIAQEQG